MVAKVAVEKLDTPCVLIDVAIVRRNIDRYQSYCTKAGLSLRPHIKTHKLEQIARWQQEAGAVGITCQKIGEAEVFAAAGFADILVTYNIVGPAKLARLVKLAGQVDNLAVVADSETVIAGLSAAFADAPKPLEVLVECDTGLRRCGVQTPAEAARLAKLIAATDGLDFGGLMTYPPPGAIAEVEEFLVAAKAQCEQLGLSCRRVSSGNSPDMWNMAGQKAVTEVRPGTYVYNDRSMVAFGVCGRTDCAISVLATVVSTPAPGRAVIDAGSKVLTTDLLNQADYGGLFDYSQVRVAALSEEHGHLLFASNTAPFKVGARVRVLPNHACVVSNMLDSVYLLDRDGYAQQAPVIARGKVA